MNRTKIDWCSRTWNPVTGCYHHCPYCYAANIATRFTHKTSSDKWSFWEEMGWCRRRFNAHHTRSLNKLYTDAGGYNFPFGFAPTFRRWRLDEPAKVRKSQNVFVCSMADLFGDWVPLDWIRDVLDACVAAPQHRYLFLTKNPSRYTDLGTIALLPHEENFWYGSTVTTDDDTGFYDSDRAIHTFLSVEPLLGPVNLSGGTPEWVIIGAETGNRINKVIPERKWVDDIRAFCEKASIPAFYKDSLRKLFPDLPESRFPWK